VTCYTEGFSHFVTSMTAPVASGWSDLAGWGLHPLESAAFSRRTQMAAVPRRRGKPVKSRRGNPDRSANRASCAAISLRQFGRARRRASRASWLVGAETRQGLGEHRKRRN
jgi:hypothetical protein